MASGVLCAAKSVYKCLNKHKELPPRLCHNLDSVIFTAGPVKNSLDDNQTPRFAQSLIKLPDFRKFDQSKLTDYVVASKDSELLKLAKSEGTRFASSTSSITQLLGKIQMVILNGRGINIGSFTEKFQRLNPNFTLQAFKPTHAQLILNDGVYSIDHRVKGFRENSNVLMEVGKVLEKFLTIPESDFTKFMLKPDGTSNDTPKDSKDTFHYTKVEDFLLRAQLDSYHPSLPNKIFDIKTRATHMVRMNVQEYNDSKWYLIKDFNGLHQSYERELYDIARSGMMKYCLQVRIGGMDGIFVAYHNTAEIFGFEYMPLEQMEEVMFGNSHVGEGLFRLSTKILNIILSETTKLLPEKEISIIFTSHHPNTIIIFASPDELFSEERTLQMNFTFKSTVNGVHVGSPKRKGLFDPIVKSAEDDWKLNYSFEQVELEHGILFDTIADINNPYPQKGHAHVYAQRVKKMIKDEESDREDE